MNEYKSAVSSKTAALISKGWTAESAGKRARKVCRHLHPLHKASVTRRVADADARHEATGDVASYNAI